MEINDEVRQHAITLVKAVRSGETSDEQRNRLINELERILRNPHILGLLFYNDPPLADEEVVEKALEYKPFAL